MDPLLAGRGVLSRPSPTGAAIGIVAGAQP